MQGSVGYSFMYPFAPLIVQGGDPGQRAAEEGRHAG